MKGISLEFDWNLLWKAEKNTENEEKFRERKISIRMVKAHPPSLSSSHRSPFIFSFSSSLFCFAPTHINSCSVCNFFFSPLSLFYVLLSSIEIHFPFFSWRIHAFSIYLWGEEHAYFWPLWKVSANKKAFSFTFSV